MLKHVGSIFSLAVFSIFISHASVAQAPAAGAAGGAKPTDFEKSMDSYLEKDENIEKIGNALQQFFMKKRKQQEEQAAVDEKSQMEEQFKNPVKIDVAGRPIKGKESAKVTIVEFSDFQCPFCKRGMEVMEDVLKEYPEDVKLVFMHLPLPFHPQAKPASIAAEAAGKQGKFWEMYTELFNNQDRLSEELYVELAGKLGLDVEKFKKDMNDEEIKKRVDSDAALAKQLGITGTPGFFVNGVQVKGARPLPYFKEIIERWKKEGKASGTA